MAEYTWDVFISHASEDRDTVARPLARALKDLGLKVWIDAFEITVGDSLRRGIDKGLCESRFGIVILSSHFFQKDWPQAELDGGVPPGAGPAAAPGAVLRDLREPVTEDVAAAVGECGVGRRGVGEGGGGLRGGW